MIEITHRDDTGENATFSSPDGTHVVHLPNPIIVAAVRELLEEHKRLKAIINDLRQGTMVGSEQRPNMHQIIENSHKQ